MSTCSPVSEAPGDRPSTAGGSRGTPHVADVAATAAAGLSRPSWPPLPNTSLDGGDIDPLRPAASLASPAFASPADAAVESLAG